MIERDTPLLKDRQSPKSRKIGFKNHLGIYDFELTKGKPDSPHLVVSSTTR